MNRKKLLPVILALLLMTVTLLSACSNNNTSTNTPGNTNESPAPSETAQPEQPKFKDTTIRIMTWQFGEESSFGQGYRAIAEDYMSLHPEVKVEFVEQPLDGYMEKLNANLELDTDTAVDIAHLQPGMIDEVKNMEKLMDLTPAFMKKSAYAPEDRWIDTFDGGEAAFDYAKASNQSGHMLFVPSDANPKYFLAQPIVYNKDLFKQAGITEDPSTWTWRQFIDNAKKVQDWGIANVDPDFRALASSNEHYGWTFAMIGGQMGADLFDDEFAKIDFSSEGEGIDPNAPYVSGDSLLWAKISYAITNGWLDYQGEMEKYYDDMLRLYKELHGLVQEGFEQQSSTEESQLFYLGRTAMMQAHMVSKADIETNTEGVFETGVFLPPMLSKEDTEFATGKFPKADGQYKDGFGVNAKKVANNPDRRQVVEDFLSYYTSKEAQEKYIGIANSFSPTKGVTNPEQLMEWVFPVEDGQTSNEIYGHMIIEWAYGTWPNYLQEYIQGKTNVKQLIESTSKEAKKNVVDWYSAEPDAIQAQIVAKTDQMNASQDEELKRILTEQINTLKIAKVLYAKAVEAGKK